MKERDNNLEITTEKKRRNVVIVVAMAICFATLVGIMAITSGMDAVEASIAEVTAEINTYQEITDKKIAELEEKIAAYGEEKAYEVKTTLESYTVEELVDLCMEEDYDSLLKVCKYQDATSEILCFAVQRIDRWLYVNITSYQERIKELTKLEMMILNHPNFTREVLVCMIDFKDDNFIPLLIMSRHNDSGTLMLLAERCKSDGRISWIPLIANHEEATEGVIRELMTITDNEAINIMLQEKLNDLQGK